MTDGEKSSATGDVVPSGKENSPLSEKIATASAEVNTEPTEAQKEAGNYKKGHVQVGTFDITIEQPQGSVRKGTDADGKQWESKMNNTYGYIRGAVGVDGDHIDVFLSNDIDGWNGRKVFVVDQYNPDGSFDEHKVMLGFNDADEAKSDYLANYENGWENGRRIDVTAVNLEDFEKWIASSKRKTKPFGDYSSVKNGVVPSGEGDTPLLDVDGKPIVVKADDGKVELNLRTWQDEKQQVRDALLDGGLEPEAVDAMMAQAETIASGMSGLADKYPLFGAWQKVAATNRPILRNNAGGYLSFDYSFNCVKKDALNAVMEALVAEGKGGHLGVTQVEALKKVLQKHGFLTPCVMCYVEAKRKVYKQSKEMAAKWNAVAEAAGLTGEEMGAERELGAEQRNALAQLANGENLGSVKGYAENGKYGIKKDTIVKIAKLMLDSAKLRGRMNYEWMMSPSSYTEMYNKFGDTGLMEFMSQGQSRGKALLETSPFSFKSVPKDLMMGMYNPVVLANIGGVRQFSYEDARAVMFFDYYTQFLVMQGARAPEHLYTKRPFMPEMFGRTGAMMNQSLIVDIWRGEEWHKKALGLSDKEYDAWLTAHAGFVPRGALPKGHTLYEAGSTELVPNWGVESFPVDIAMKNVHNKDYKGTVGNVVVAPNRKFILWALDNPDIHMVLAYHANGANPLVKSLTGYDRAEAMDDGYHTHDENGKVVDELSVPEIGLEIHDGDLQWNVLLRRNGYDARKAAQVYLDYCKEHGLTPMFCYDGVVDMSGERATSHPEYYKLLTDFRVYDEDGNSIRQRAVKALLPENWQVILDKYLQQESALGSKVGHIGLDEGLMKEINAVTRFASIESGERDTLTKLLTSIYGKDNVQVLATREFDAALDEVTERGHAQMLRDNGGTVYGFAVGDRIVLNENLFNANTPMHEHTHVYMKVLKATNPRLYNRGMELWRDTPLWKQAKRGLEELGEEPTDEQIFSECMSQFTGAENEKVISEVTGITDKNWLQKAMSWLSEMWKGVKSAFSRWTQNDLDGLTAEQFGRMPLRAVYDAKERKAYAKRVKQVFGNGGAGEHGVEMMHEPSREETILRDVVIEHMKGSGLDVIGTEEGQRVLDMANGRYVRLEAKQKRALETATIAEQSTNNATVVSSADGAKVQKVLETLADNYEKRPNKTRGFITDLSRSLGLVQHEASQYGTFETRNGKLVTIRVSNHNARVSFFDENGEEDGISIVISSHKNKGVLNDGKAHLVEYFYPKQSLERSGGKPLADIVKCVSTVLESGKFEDTTGLAQRQEVNAQQIREHRVYHGSGAEFDHFDHSHMSEGEGSQVYGWGTYVTEVKGIAEGYAIRARNGISNINEEWYLKRGELESNIYRAKEQLPFLKGEYKAEMEAQISEWEKQLKEYDGPNNLYTVEIPGDNGSNYLAWNEPLSVEDSGRIISGLFDLPPSDIEEMAKRDYTFKHILYDLIKINDKAQFVPVLAKGNVLSRSTMYDGGREINDFGGVYRRLQGWFGSAKAVSKFLYSLGYAGIKYPADYRSGGREDNAKNYVIFNENDAEITDHVRFFKTKNGEAYGFTVGGKIYYDPRIANAETPVHEYAHLWASALKANNAKEWKNVVDLMKGTNVWEEVKKTYPELETDDEIADEVLATYSGRRGAERLREEMRKAAAEGDGVMGKAEAVSALQRVKRAIDKFWKAVADFLHIHYTSAEEVADRVMKDLLDGVDPRSMMDGGKSLRPETRVNVVEAEAGHGFKNYAEAKAWAKEHIARTYSGEETGGKGDIRISNAAVDKYLSQSAVDKSESKDVHLAVLKVLPDVIRESVDAEQHADFKKGEDGVRSAENGINPDVTIHRLYGAVRMDGKVYRVKVTLKEDSARSRDPKKAYSYEATKIELLAGQHGKDSETERFPRNSNNSITAANLLNGVEKSYDGGKFFEDYNKIREQFIGEKGAAAADHADEVNTRLDNLSVAREMEAEKKDAKAIKMATGWERGADGKWRYEVGDVRFYDGLQLINRSVKTEATLNDLLEDNKDKEALFASYPSLKNMPVVLEDMGYKGAGEYNYGKGTIRLNTYLLTDNDGYFTKPAVEILNHEIQHAIQKIEGFARGGSPAMVRSEIKKQMAEVTKQIRQLRAEGKEAEAKELIEKNRGLYEASVGDDDFGSYKSLAGEVESRNVESRMGMSAAERRASLAAETEDVSREDQIFLTSGDGGNANSEMLQETGTENDYSEFAKEHGVDADMVKDYALGMETGNLHKADFALAEIRRTMRVANRGMKLSEFGKLFRPVQKELAERYGDIEKLRQEHIDAEMRERGVMEAARKRAEEEAAKRKARADELRLLPEEELDRRYFEAVERGDDAAAREMLDEAARRKGYDDTESKYQGVGAWVAPSNPGYETDEARRDAVGEDAPDLNVEDMAAGYSNQPEDIFVHPDKYSQGLPTSKESGKAIQTAIDDIRNGKKEVKIKVYRAVPTSVKESKLRNGDWVTPSKEYAEMHGNNRLEGKYRIIEEEVPAGELWWDSNDVNEWGFDDGKGYKYKNVENSRKLNDLVTRDDNGEIIAPSKRFDQRKADERYHKVGTPRKPNSAEVALRDVLIEHMRGSGLDVIGTEDGQRVLDMANDDGAKEHRVYHGSGAEFDHFDHSHMGEGEGAQAYGWGTYVTEVKGIGEGYAIQNSEEPRTHYVYNGDTHGLSEERINEILEVLLDAGPSEGHIVSEYNDALGWYSGKRDEYCQYLAKDASLLNPSDISVVVDKTRNLYTVEIPEDNGKNYLDWNSETGKDLVSRLVSILRADKELKEAYEGRLSELNKELGKFAPRTLFSDTYVQLAELLGSDKKASQLLSSLGYVGIKYPADNLRGGRKDGAQNYVIFNENDAEITDHVRFFKTKNGEAYGFTVGGKIYYDPRIANAETPVHEYAHLWAEALRNGNAEEWKNVVELMKGTPVWNEVKARYTELKSDDEIADEVIATYSGRRGAERLREEQRKIADGDGSVSEKAAAISALERVKQALKKFWKAVADFLHIHYKSAEEVADRVMKDLLDGVDPRKFMGNNEKGFRFSAKQKRALETASLGNAPRSLTVVSSVTGAKVLNSIDKLVDSLEKSATQPKTFIGNVSKALGASRFGSGSEYATFETKNGDVVTIRLANHNAHVSGFDHNGKDNGISIVISPKPNEGITNDGNAHITEFYYDSIKLRRADGKPLADIVRSIKQALYSGEFKDTTGLAERQEVNGDDVIRFQLIGENDAATAEGLKDVVEKMKADVERLHEGELDDLRSGARAIGGRLSELNKAMRLQRAYDMSTVASVTELAKTMLKNGLLSEMSDYDVHRLLSVVNNVHGKGDIRLYVQKVVDMMVGNRLRNVSKAFDKLLAMRGKKVDARGVEVQGELDLAGQRMADVVWKGIGMSDDDVADMCADAQDRMMSANGAEAAAAATDYAGWQIVMRYNETIRDSKSEEVRLREDLKRAKEDYDAGRMTREAYMEFRESTNDAIRENRIERAEAYEELYEQLGGAYGESIKRAADFKAAEKARVLEIQHNANSDMEGRPARSYRKDTAVDKVLNSSPVQLLFAPLGTFDQMLRMFGSKNVKGEGYLWNRYMRGWLTATENEYTGYRDATAELDAKAAEVLGKGKTWADLFALERKLPKATVRVWDNGEMRELELPQGNLLYIYMVDKMADGRMKLRKMGVTEDDVAAIEDFLDPRLKEIGDWLQEVYLVEKRGKYNEVHERMFGAAMASIDNYFPLKILKDARAENVDVGVEKRESEMASTITGSVVKRTRNALALDLLNSDAFSVVLDHLQQMEHWSAFAEWNRDLNTLLSYKHFRNQVKNMRSAYGSGERLWEAFDKVARIAAGTYTPPKAFADKLAVNIAKGVTAAKISLRVFTALKQFTSFPAYLSDSNPVYLLKGVANPYGSWKWCMENLPLFEKRWKSRMAGDPRLLKNEMDWGLWRDNVVQMAAKWGMTPNGFVDALTVCIGARAMYETRRRKYIRYGYGLEEAERRAKQDASILYNQTQQSSEGAFLSALQVDRSWYSVLFTVFRNSSMSYTRQLYAALRNTGRRIAGGAKFKGMSEAFMAKQMERDGIDPEKASKNAKAEYRKSWINDLVRAGVFGYVLQLAWNCGPYALYMLFGDDEKKGKEMWHDIWTHTAFGSVEGLTGGDVWSAGLQSLWNHFVNGEDFNANSVNKDMPLTSDLLNVVKKVGSDNYGAVNDVLNLLVQAGFGVNPQTLTDAAVAIYDYCGSDVETTKECALLVMRVMNCPQSQMDNIYFDEIDATGEEAKSMSVEEIAERYARYKALRSAPLRALSSDALKAAEKKPRERVLTEAKEQLDGRLMTEEAQRYLDEYEATKKKVTETRALADTDPKAFMQQMPALARSGEFRRYRRVGLYKREVDKLTKKLLRTSDPAERRALFGKMLDARDKMLKQVREME